MEGASSGTNSSGSLGGLEGDSRQLRGIVAMAGCAILWSLAGIFIKLIDWQPFAIACGRSLIASIFLWACIRKPKFTFSSLQIGTAFAYAATMLLFIFANKNTSAANAILLQYGAPIYVALLGGPILKEKPAAEHWVALVAICIGMGLFFMDSLGSGNLLGDSAAVAAGLAFALNTVLLRKQKDADPLSSLLLGHILTAVIAGAISLFLPAPTITLKSVGAILGLGILQIGLAAILFAYAIKRITALQSMLTAVLEPILNPVWVFLATGEKPSARSLSGGAIIVLAVMISSAVTVHRSRNRVS
ncbi:MAG: DMT family transporter [Spirochaetaceae bacterium]|nr:DMT family transporter [Spirochaetaceae bacterium]